MTTCRKPLPPGALSRPSHPEPQVSPSTTPDARQGCETLVEMRREDGNYFDLRDVYQRSDIDEGSEPPYDWPQFYELNQKTQDFPPGRPQPLLSQSTELRGNQENLVSEREAIAATSTQIPVPNTKSRLRPKLVTAAEETSLFLGGLISHPVESTKRFTILRHSHGLVYYKGPETSLAVSIFSIQPLPVDRRLWLQLKGWSGNTGMTVKALFGSNDNWINVTPEKQVSAVDLPSLDERAWQRDIKKFATKAKKTQQKHILRETCVVRIPFEASDGYFRLVLTTGDSKTVLCPSPVFRVASTSLSASSLRGSSLKTLPLELGVMAAQTAANVAASKAIAAAAPLKMAAQNWATSATPIQQYGGYVQTAWDMSGAQDQLTAANERYEQRLAEKPALDRTLSTPAHFCGSVVGDDAGPASPFPIRLTGTVKKGSGKSTATFKMPTANLDDLPSDQLSSIATGVHFGWALVITPDATQSDLHGSWRQTIITVSFASSNTSSVAQRKTVRSYLLHDFPPGTSFVGSKLKLAIMGSLRPLTQANDEDVFALETVNDIAITRASLSRPGWSHEQMIRRAKTAQAERSIGDRLVGMRVAGQRQVDRVPIHKLGLRSETVGMHDRGVYGNGGVWVKRD